VAKAKIWCSKHGWVQIPEEFDCQFCASKLVESAPSTSTNGAMDAIAGDSVFSIMCDCGKKYDFVLNVSAVQRQHSA